ncbi:Os01g0871350, partial [Oryza sativa Japonica Group]
SLSLSSYQDPSLSLSLSLQLHSPGVSFSPGLKRTAGFAIPGARSNSRRESNDSNFSCIITMSLACLVCHGMSSPSHSFRSYSVSSSEEENRCGAVVACLTRRVMPAGTANTVGTSKVTPFPLMAAGQGTEGAPRLQRSRAVSRDLVRDWNFEEIAIRN